MYDDGAGWVWYGMDVIRDGCDGCVVRDRCAISGMGVIRDGCDGCVIRDGCAMGWAWYGMGVIRDGCDGCGRGWKWKMEGSETGVDGCGRGWGWKMEGSETGCGRVWTGVRMELWTGERGVVVGGQRPCTKHVSGLVSNMLRCGLKYSRKWGWRGCFRIYICIFLIHAGQLPTVFCGRLQPYRLQEKGVAFGFAGSPCFLLGYPGWVGQELLLKFSSKNRFWQLASPPKDAVHCRWWL